MSKLDLIRCDLLASHRVTHGFTTRLGGVSEGVYSSLNITRSRGDVVSHVMENRRRLRSEMGLDHLVFAAQVHGSNIIRIDRPPKGDLPAGEGDALITDQLGVGLVCQTADCTPVLIHDPVRGVVAAIHSGWRSTVLDIIGQTVSAMQAEYGSVASELIAAIGPSISASNYRVGPEVVAQFEARFADNSGVLSSRDEDGGSQLDVGEACRIQLVGRGLQPGKIWRSPLCTYAEEDRLFSARRSHHNGMSGIFGGQCGVIGLVGTSGSSSS